MPWDPLFDIGSVMGRLRPVIELQRPRTGADFAAALPQLVALPRYHDAGGPDRLLHDLQQAIDDSLPLDPDSAVQDRDWARLILGLDQPHESITSRRRDIPEPNGSARKYRDRFVVQSALHRLQLMALEGPPGSSEYDCGFELQSVEARLTARTRYPLNLRHQVILTLRAARGGQRLVALCFGGSISFTSISATVLSPESPAAQHIGSTEIVANDPLLPTHFFWLSYPPVPGSTLVLSADFEEIHRKPWAQIDSRLRLITGDTPVIRFSVQPRRSFRSIQGFRLASDGSDPVEDFRTGRKRKGELPLYKTVARRGDEAFELHCLPSDRCITHQRRHVSASHIPL
jgi:hypothetical protein